MGKLEPRFEDLPQLFVAMSVKMDKMQKQLDDLSNTREATDAKPINARQAAEFLGISRRTFDRRIQARELPYSQCGKRKLFSKQDLLASLYATRKKTIAEMRPGFNTSKMDIL